MTESIPVVSVHDLYRAGDKSTGNWADRPDELDYDYDYDYDYDCWQYVDFHFTGKIPGL